MHNAIFLLLMMGGSFLLPPASIANGLTKEEYRGMVAGLTSVAATDTVHAPLFPALGFAGTPSRVRIHLAGTGGDYYTVQQAESSLGGGFQAMGTQASGEWMMFGMMHVTQQQDQAVRWTAQSYSVLDQPYLWADSASADWTRRGVQLHASLLSPVWGSAGLRGAIKLHHHVEQGATRQDPRPLYRHTRYGLRAGITTKRGHRSVGWFAGYAKANEESEIGVFSRTNPRVFYIRGLATMSTANVVRAVRTWDEDRFETGMHWRQQNTYLTLELAYRNQNNTDGTSNPVFAGRYQLIEAQTTLSAPLRSHTQLSLESLIRSGQGTDPLFNQVNVSKRKIRHTLEMHKINPRWSFIEDVRFQIGHEVRSQEDIVGFASYDIHHLHYSIQAEASLTKYQALPLLKVELFGSELLSGTYIRERPALITTQITDPQVHYMMSSLAGISVEGRYGFYMNRLPVQLRIGGSHLRVTRSDDGLSGRSRTLLHTSVEIPF